MTSARFLPAADVREIREESGRIVPAAAECAGLGFVTSSGRRVILRTMPPGNEVRGLLPACAYDHADAIGLLDNTVFWASSHFECARAVRAPMREGEAPSRWDRKGSGLASERPDAAGTPSRCTESAPPGGGLARPEVARAALARRELPAPAGPAPAWVLHACAAAAAAGVLFMAIALALSLLEGQRGDSPGTDRPAAAGRGR